MTIDTDRLAEGYFAWSDPQFQADDDELTEDETLCLIDERIKEIFLDLTEQEKEYALQNADHIMQTVRDQL